MACLDQLQSQHIRHAGLHGSWKNAFLQSEIPANVFHSSCRFSTKSCGARSADVKLGVWVHGELLGVQRGPAARGVE